MSNAFNKPQAVSEMVEYARNNGLSQPEIDYVLSVILGKEVYPVDWKEELRKLGVIVDDSVVMKEKLLVFLGMVKIYANS